MSKAPLGEVCTVLGGGTPSRRNPAYFGSGIPWATPTDVTGLAGLTISQTKEQITEFGLRKSSARLLPIGTVLMTSRATIGHTAVATTPMATNQGFANFICSDVLMPQYLALWLREHRQLLIQLAGGTTFREITKTRLKRLEIPIPSFDVQSRIVDILSAADSVENLLAETEVRCREFGSPLFAKKFGRAGNYAKSYDTVKLADIATVTAGDPAPQDEMAFAPDGCLFVRMQDVGRDHVNPALSASADRIEPAWLRKNRLRLFPAGSTLIPKSGASVNLNHRAMLAVDAYVVSHLAIVIPDLSRIDPHYLFWWSVGYDPRAQAQVTSLPSLKLTTIKEASLPLPPLDEQQRFAHVAKRALRTTAKVEAASRKAADLRESLIARLLRADPG